MAHGFIDGHAVYLLVLELAGAGVGGLYKHENTLVVVAAGSEKRLYAVAAEVAVYSQRVAEERLVGLAAYLYFAQMSRRVCLHRGADVVALAVGDDVHTLAARVLLGLVESLDARRTVHLIISRLRLHCGDDIVQRVDKPLVEFQQSLRSALEGLAVLLEALLLDVLRNICELGVKPCNGGVLGLFDLFDESVE